MPTPVAIKRVNTIGDNTVQYRIVQEVQELGATGYTCYPVSGKRQRGIWPRHAEPANVKIEIIATPEVAQRILNHIGDHYLDKYAMIAFLDDVHDPRRKSPQQRGQQA